MVCDTRVLHDGFGRYPAQRQGSRQPFRHRALLLCGVCASQRGVHLVVSKHSVLMKDAVDGCDLHPGDQHIQVDGCDMVDVLI